MTHQMMLLHLFGEKCANQHQHRIAKEKKKTYIVWVISPLQAGSH